MSQYPPPMGYSPPPPPLPMGPPGVIVWFKVYCVVMILVYLLVAGLGILFLTSPDILIDPDAGFGSNQPADEAEAMIMGVIYTALGVVLAIVFAVGLVWTRGKGAWIYGIVLICLSLTSCLCWPTSIPLLIFWIKPECKTWFESMT